MSVVPRRAFGAWLPLLLCGSAASTYGYLLTVDARLGNGPMLALQDGFEISLHWSRGFAALVVGLAIALFGWALRAPLGLATVLMPVLTSVWVGVLDPYVPVPSGLVGRWLAFAFGTTVMMAGVALVAEAAMGLSPVDGAMVAVARHLGCTTAAARIGLEASMAGGALLIGGRLGLGTLVMAVAVGPLFSFWTRFVSTVLAPAPRVQAKAGSSSR